MAKNIVSPKKKPRRIVGAAGLPQLTYRGGRLIQNVEVTTIYWGNAWSNDPIRAQLDAFFDFIVTSSLIDQLAEYNVPGFTIGHGKHVASLVVPQDPPATVDDSAHRRVHPAADCVRRRAGTGCKLPLFRFHPVRRDRHAARLDQLPAVLRLPRFSRRKFVLCRYAVRGLPGL